MTELLTTIDETFHQRGIDLSSCMQKALCQRLLQPEEHQSNNQNDRKSSALDQIVDGLVGLKWVRQNILRFSSLNDIVADGDDDGMLTMKHQRKRLSCEARYPKCRWSIPKSQNVDSLFGTYLKFI